MTQPLTPTAQFTALIPGIQELAQFIVEEIHAFQPDLLIGLAHSGWLPVLAAQTVWERHHGAPFPPALRLNFGQEKLDPHNELWGQTDHNELGLDRAPFPFLAHVLYWAGEQAQWREELAQMGTAVLGPLPLRRILVVDEGVMDGTTYWPLMGLLTAVYPQADIRFSSGHFFHWGNHATAAWLEQHSPDTLARLEEAQAQLADDRPKRRQLRDALRWVATGTEDGDPHSLHYLPVDEASQSVRLLSAYLPAAHWLQIAPWAHQTILAQVRRITLAQPGPLPPDKHRSYRASQRNGRPDDIALILYIWQQGSVTRRDVAAWGNLSLSEASRRLRRLARWGYIAALGWGGGTRYTPDPAYRPEFAETFGGPGNNAYWVIPGKLLAGPHPLTSEGFLHEAYQGLTWLQAQGIDCLLDLAGPQDIPWHHGGAMAAHLETYAEKHGGRFSFQELPWSQYETPTPDQLHHLLRVLDDVLGEGRAVYLYSYRGTGRAAIAAAAYLVGQGETPRDAWRFLNQQWGQTTWGTYRRLPDTEAQRRFLRQL